MQNSQNCFWSLSFGLCVLFFHMLRNPGGAQGGGGTGHIEEKDAGKSRMEKVAGEDCGGC